MLFWLLFGAIILVLCKLGKDTIKLIDRFSDTSPTKRAIWQWTKRCCLIGVSLLLIWGSIQRWYSFHNELYYAKDKKHLTLSYADQVEIKTYLMSHQEVIALFEGRPPNPDTRTISEQKPPVFYNEMNPTDPRFYLVIALKNKGDQICWGILENYANGKRGHIVDVPPISGKMQDYRYIVIRAYPGEQNIPGDYPNLEAKWLYLYTSQGEKS